MPALAEAPAAETAMTPIGEVYAKAMAAQNPPAEPVAEPVVEKSAPEKPPAEKPTKAAPKSAMDAALDGGEPTKAEPVAEEDPLKEFPLDSKEKNWKGLRGAAEKAFTELKELRAKAGKSEPDPAILTELSTVKATLKEREAALAEREAKLAEYNDAMTALDLKNRPDFRQEFYVERDELVKSAAAKLKNYGGNPEAIVEALEMPEGKRRDAAIEEALAELETDSAKDKIRRYVSEIEAKDEKRDKALANSQQSFEELERKTIAQRQKQAAESEQVKAAEFDRIARELHKTVPTLAFVDESFADGKEWNAAVRQAQEDAFKLFSPDATYPDMVTTAIQGKDYARVTKLLMAERKETATLRAQLAQFDDSQPVIKGGKPAAKNARDAALEKSPGELYKQTLAQLSGGDDL